jgi:hypothetical protein
MINSQFLKAEDLKTEILEDIEMLVKIEDDLTQSLENSQLTLEKRNKIISDIQSVSHMRINLYDILEQINGYLQSTLSNATNTLTDQTFALKIIENEIQLSKNKLSLLQEDKYNKYRQVEINTYYSQKYSDHNKLILWIIAILAILTFIVFLNKKNLISYTVYFWLLLITTILGLILIFYKINNMSRRNNMNYQEYDINMDTKNYNRNRQTSNTKVDHWKSKDADPPICVNN